MHFSIAIKELKTKIMKYLISSICIFCLTINPANSQQIDSLQTALKNTNDPQTKISLLHEIHGLTSSNDAPRSKKIALEAIQLGKQYNLEETFIKSYQDLGVSYIMLGQVDSALDQFKFAQSIAIKYNDKRGEAQCIRKTGTAWWYKNDIEKAISYYKQSLEIFKKLELKNEIANNISNIATSYYALGDFKKSIEYYERAYELIDTTKFQAEAASWLNDIGTIYKEWGNRTKALELFLESARINKKVNNKRNLAAALHNIGGIYYEDGKYDLAKSYYLKGWRMDKSTGSSYGEPFSFMALSHLYLKTNQIDSAIHYLQKAKTLFIKFENKQGIAQAYFLLGQAYSQDNKYAKSIELYQNAIHNAQEIKDSKTFTEANSALGMAYFKLKKFKKALHHFTISNEIAAQGNLYKLMEKNYRHLAEINKALGNKDLAIENLETYVDIKDSVLNREKQKQASELLAKYETEKKEARIKLLNKEQEINQGQLKTQKIVLIAAAIILIIIAFAVVLLYRRYKDKKRTNQLLNSQNTEIQKKQEKIELQNKKLETQAKQLTELDEIKTRFFTNISHEFRTPLTLIIGPLEQLIEHTKNSEKRSTLKLMMRNARRLLELINQLLSISRLEQGQEKLNLQETDIAKHLAFITEMFSSKAKEHGNQLVFTSNPQEITGLFDREKLEQILFNLLSNAIKHTAQGRIEITITQKIDYVQITVKDNGKGIPKDQVPYIFDRFYTTGQNNESTKASSGIGLAYVNEIVKLYNGKIEVESAEEKGTEFILTVPSSPNKLKKDSYCIIGSEKEYNTDLIIEETDEESIEQTENTERKKLKVLVVDDHDELRQFISSNLATQYEIIQAENGQVGIEMARNESPELIITDIMMPIVDGIELTKTLKSDNETSHIPIIMLTAKASEESIIEGLETRADDYLTKPFSIKQLSLRVKNILRMRELLREKYATAIEVNPTEITTNSLDAQFMQKLLQIVEENMDDTGLNVDFLCEKMSTSRTTLHKKLKSIVNQSATEFINSIRLKRAAQLLQNKSGNISDIAYQVGFNNLSYFSRLFKKQFGKSPKEMIGE
jgi:signal transduction histidine kinase/DNA-binding NarL/FixJ family response regulator